MKLFGQFLMIVGFMAALAAGAAFAGDPMVPDPHFLLIAAGAGAVAGVAVFLIQLLMEVIA